MLNAALKKDKGMVSVALSTLKIRGRYKNIKSKCLYCLNPIPTFDILERIAIEQRRGITVGTPNLATYLGISMPAFIVFTAVIFQSSEIRSVLQFVRKKKVLNLPVGILLMLL